MVRKISSPGSYLIVNIIFAGVILLIMGYSLFFSPEKNNYPVVCIHERITGQKCPSCGMSHAFSFLVRGKFEEASKWNESATRVFFFFVMQFFMRAGLSVWLCSKRNKPVVVGYLDGAISFVMMLIAFYPILSMQWKLLLA